ncbi:hypothetical protein F3J34_30375 [Klebsiella sp. Ap-873]|nr:hypothetical protein [Klebsiella sp. Ap-873]
MVNAKEEFLLHINDPEKPKIKCALLRFGYEWDTDAKEFLLPASYSRQQMDAFLESINFKYDDGYGGQVLFGNIWYEDGTFSVRGEYDGSEWWEYMRCPEIPSRLIELPG